ncbi:MAG: lysophospholipid acyltransferase family protein [Rhodospirillaceae bacterium]
MKVAYETMPTGLFGYILGIVRVLFFFLWTIGLGVIFGLVRLTSLTTSHIRVLYFRGLCQVCGIRVIVHGEVSRARPLLIVSNHISYLDILVFGSVTELEFVSKEEVARWPVIGLVAKLGNVVFVERRRSKTAYARDSMAARIAAKKRLIFFPEATTSDGSHLLPFKSALFAAADTPDGGPIATVQPVAIAYTHLNGLPITTQWRHFFAWYGDMSIASHAWRFLQLGHTTVNIVVQQPVQMARLGSRKINRKALAREAELSVNAGFNRLISGRIAL